MKRSIAFLLGILCLFVVPAIAGETVSIVYQNDLHGWLFPSSTRAGIGTMADTLLEVFQEERSSFYALSGDLFTGPNLPEDMKGRAELDMWNEFWRHMSRKGLGQRILISAGNHEFDYGVQCPEAFSSGLLCANLLDRQGRPYYVPHRVMETTEGLRIGVIGLIMEKNDRVLEAAQEKGLQVISMLTAVRKSLAEMGRLDLTVLMIHEGMTRIFSLVDSLPADLGIDMILSGHEHLVLEQPIVHKGIPIFQVGAMNSFYGRVDLVVEEGRISSFKNTLIPVQSSPLEHVLLKVKEKVDEGRGKTVASLTRPLTGGYSSHKETNLGDFVTDAFRWATGSHVAMTNSGSLRMGLLTYPGEITEVKEGDLKSISPFENHLVTGNLKGAHILKIVEGEGEDFQNQVSGLTYTLDLRLPKGSRVLKAEIGGRPVEPDQTYTLTHNSYCTRPDKMETFLHLKAGSVEWKDTGLLDYQVLTDYARHLKVIDYPEEGQGRILILRP